MQQQLPPVLLLRHSPPFLASSAPTDVITSHIARTRRKRTRVQSSFQSSFTLLICCLLSIWTDCYSQHHRLPFCASLAFVPSSTLPTWRNNLLLQLQQRQRQQLSKEQYDIISHRCFILNGVNGEASAENVKQADEGASDATQDKHSDDKRGPIHTLLLCRHGDSIWNGGEPGTQETFTGWTNVPLSSKGIQEAMNTGQRVSEFEWGIDACFTSILQRAQLTAHYCLWGFGEKPNVLSPRKYIQDYRLNERHYGALQGLVKEDVERGLHGHDPADVQAWRRSWYTVPPLLDEDDPRRQQEIKAFQHFCGEGGADNVPRGESLEQVAEDRIRPFLQQVLCPVLEESTKQRKHQEQGFESVGGIGLVVAHANSLRALIGVICHAKEDPKALAKLEALRLQTGVPLVIRFRIVEKSRSGVNENNTAERYEVCDLDGLAFGRSDTLDGDSSSSGNRLVNELPVYPLSSIPLKAKPGSSAYRELSESNRRSKKAEASQINVPF